MPDGEMPQGETKEIKVDDSTTYTKLGDDNTSETIALSDITEGQMVAITYADDGETAVSIEVRDMTRKQKSTEQSENE